MGVSPVKPGEAGTRFSGSVLKNTAEKSADVSTEKTRGNFSPGLDFLKNPLTKNPDDVSGLSNRILLSLGLKQDNLNRALLVFSRLFSIDLSRAADPAALLTEFRRYVLDAAAGEVRGKTEKAEASKTESRALAAAALADKGVKLSPAAFEKYAAVLGGEDFSHDASEDGGTYGRNGNGGHADDGGSAGGSGGGNTGESSYGRGGKENGEEPGPAELRSLKLRSLFDKFMNGGLLPEGSGGGETLRFLNMIPGKNGQRWIVWPFKINVEGVELNVLIRLLLHEPLSAGYGRMFLNASGPSSSWSFILEKSRGGIKVSVSIFPERTAAGLKKIKSETEKILGFFGPLEVQAGNGAPFPSLADFLENEVLLSVNKEV